MTDDVGNLILRRLRPMDDRSTDIEGDLGDVKTRMSAIEEHIGGIERRSDISDRH